MNPAPLGEQIPPPSPMTRHGQLEVDAFCICGYNLHGQIVSLDERLGFPICRCPECGRYHPAGTGVTSRSLWLHRFAASLLAVWVLFVLLVCFLLTLAMGAMQNAAVDDFTYGSYMTSDGRPVTQGPLPNNGGYGYMITGTTTIVPRPIYRRTLQPPPNQNPLYTRDTTHDLALFIFFSSLLGFLLGMLLVTFLWHWSRRRYIFAIIFPMIASGFILFGLLSDESYDPLHNWLISRVMLILAVQCAAVLLGVTLGRKLSRTIARTVIPPKPRQMLAFLWIADGKPPPPVELPKI